MKNEDILNQLVENLKSRVCEEKLVSALSVKIENNEDYACGNFFIAGKSYPFCSLMLDYKGDIHVFFFPISECVALALCAEGWIISPKLSIVKNLTDYQVHQFEYNQDGEREIKHFMCKSLLELVSVIYRLLEVRVKVI